MDSPRIEQEIQILNLVDTLVNDFWFTADFLKVGISRESDEGIKLTRAVAATFTNKIETLTKGLI